MKKIIIILTVFIYSSVCRAQDGGDVMFNLKTGLSIPTGKYGLSSVNDNAACFAKTGISYGFEVDYFLIKNFAGCLHFTHNSHPVDVDGVSNLYLATGAVNNFVKVEFENYRVNTLMTGIKFKHNLSSNGKLKINAKVLAGLFNAVSGENTVNIDNALILNTSEARATRISYLTGLGFEYFLTDNFGMGLGTEISSANPEFETIDLDGKTQTTTQETSFLNTFLTFTYKLQK